MFDRKLFALLLTSFVICELFVANVDGALCGRDREDNFSICVNGKREEKLPSFGSSSSLVSATTTPIAPVSPSPVVRPISSPAQSPKQTGNVLSKVKDIEARLKPNAPAPAPVKPLSQVQKNIKLFESKAKLASGKK
ncbi:uncharacterized protein LOC116346067 [Contarinia nasturtii]|uniref:uncharacterized protein LOC116346067 n=1 Tax=Contarinia nasturtii TaxID=265458 RepID=UPI0012D37DAE|nr:uncharacterized protein LOC116346067 [Contarinia nasturtii]